MFYVIWLRRLVQTKPTPHWFFQVSVALYLKYFFCFLWHVSAHLSRLQKSSWIISVELAIGPEEGISYLTDKGCNVSAAAAVCAHDTRPPLGLVVGKERSSQGKGPCWAGLC